MEAHTDDRREHNRQVFLHATVKIIREKVTSPIVDEAKGWSVLAPSLNLATVQRLCKQQKCEYLLVEGGLPSCNSLIALQTEVGNLLGLFALLKANITDFEINYTQILGEIRGEQARACIGGSVGEMTTIQAEPDIGDDWVDLGPLPASNVEPAPAPAPMLPTPEQRQDWLTRRVRQLQALGVKKKAEATRIACQELRTALIDTGAVPPRLQSSTIGPLWNYAQYANPDHVKAQWVVAGA